VGWAQEHVHGRVENSVEIDAASKLVSRGSGHWNEIVGAVRNAGTVDVDHRLDVGAGLVNSGIVNVNDSLIVTGPLVNQGRITVNGALEYTEMVLDGGTVVAASLNVSSDREIRGIGRLQANVTNSGVVTPGSPFGTIEITGNYSQTGKLEAGIGSASPTDFGRVLVAGNASIGGTLDVNVLDGARFDAGGTFDLLTANAVAGQFSNIILPVGSSGLPLFSVSYLPNAVRLTALQTVAPPTGQWNAIATGDWGVRANWLGDLPNSVGAVASFPAIVAPSCAVTVGAPVIVGAINFPDVTACNVTGVGLLTMEVLVGRASIVSDGGLHTISVPIELASDADITVSKGTLTMSGSITNTTGRTLTKMGGGALVVNGRQTYEPAAALEVLAGAVSLESDAGAGGANLSVTVGAAGTAHFGSTQRLAGLSIVGGGAADLVAGHDKVMLVSSLAIDPAGKLDLADNAMIVQAAIGSRDSVLANIGQLIAAGRNKGAWNGTGIISSAAASSGLTGLAVMLNDRGDGVPLVTTFDGLSVGANSILVKFTWNGDANLDGIINADDYFQIDSGFISQKKGWYNGDLNYDGVVNADDYFLIDSAFIGQSGPLSAGHSRASAVPEPGALGLLLAGAATLITRRRRHHQPRPNRPDPPDLPDAGNLVHHADLSRRRVEI
ncbi:MAG: PEP-CTERM sorting domain-containing protein, partial [Planctomycetota bacterium]|nr:PEP-CTERM sorting domain-containing protein [Planctomycetota bacterium]